KASRLVCVFSGMFTDDPVRAAITAARDVMEGLDSPPVLAAQGKATPSVALHLAPLVMRRKERGPPAVYGVAVEQPASWVPRGPFRGLVLTAQIARAVPDAEAGRVEQDGALDGVAGAAFFRLKAP